MELFETESPRAQRIAKRILKVTMTDGNVVCYRNATQTFMEVLRRIGIDKLKDVKLEVRHLPMITQECYEQYKENMKPLCLGWFVNTQGDTGNKFRQLTSINNQLGLGLRVEFGTEYDIQKFKSFVKTGRETSQLLVKMQNGKFIGGANPIDTYKETIEALGIDEVMRKHIILQGKELITTKAMYKGQIEISANKWLTVPGLTKEKSKWLKVISSFMRANLEISII